MITFTWTVGNNIKTSHSAAIRSFCEDLGIHYTLTERAVGLLRSRMELTVSESEVELHALEAHLHALTLLADLQALRNQTEREQRRSMI